MWTMNFQMFKLVLEKAEEQEIKLPTSTGSLKSKRVPEKHLLLLYWLYPSLWVCGSQQTMENSERDRNTRPPYLPPEKYVCRSRRNSHNWMCSNCYKIGKGVYYHYTYLTHMQSTSCKILCCIKQKLESRLLGEILLASEMQVKPSLWQKVKRN